MEDATQAIKHVMSQLEVQNNDDTEERLICGDPSGHEIRMLACWLRRKAVEPDLNYIL